MLTVSSCATRRGSLNGASIVAKVSPGTPATANSPGTRSGWRKASSNIVLTPIDQPIAPARSMPKWSITERASSTNASMPQWAGSAGRSEPPVPRWFQEMTRTPQSGRSSAGQAHGVVPSPLHSTTVGPSIARRGRWSMRRAGCRRRTARRRRRCSVAGATPRRRGRHAVDSAGGRAVPPDWVLERVSPTGALQSESGGPGPWDAAREVGVHVLRSTRRCGKRGARDHGVASGALL